MQLLPDAHILIWALKDHPALSARAGELIRATANKVFVSSVSLFEIVIRIRRDRLHARPTSADIIADVGR